MEGLIGLVGIIGYFMWMSINEIKQDKAIKDAVQAALDNK